MVYLKRVDSEKPAHVPELLEVTSQIWDKINKTQNGDAYESYFFNGKILGESEWFRCTAPLGKVRYRELSQDEVSKIYLDNKSARNV